MLLIFLFSLLLNSNFNFSFFLSSMGMEERERGFSFFTWKGFLLLQESWRKTGETIPLTGRSLQPDPSPRSSPLIAEVGARQIRLSSLNFQQILIKKSQEECIVLFFKLKNCSTTMQKILLWYVRLFIDRDRPQKKKKNLCGRYWLKAQYYILH